MARNAGMKVGDRPATEAEILAHEEAIATAKSRQDALTALEEIDKKAIRAIRECLAANFPDFSWDVNGTPTKFSDIEAKANTERGKLK